MLSGSTITDVDGTGVTDLTVPKGLDIPPDPDAPNVLPVSEVPGFPILGLAANPSVPEVTRNSSLLATVGTPLVEWVLGIFNCLGVPIRDALDIFKALDAPGVPPLPDILPGIPAIFILGVPALGVFPALGIPGILNALGVPGILKALGIAGILKALGVPDLLKTLGVAGVLKVVGVSGVLKALGVAGVLKVLGVPTILKVLGVLGILPTLGVPGIFPAPGVTGILPDPRILCILPAAGDPNVPTEVPVTFLLTLGPVCADSDTDSSVVDGRLADSTVTPAPTILSNVAPPNTTLAPDLQLTIDSALKEASVFNAPEFPRGSSFSTTSQTFVIEIDCGRD